MSRKALKFFFHWMSFIGLILIMVGNFVLHRYGLVLTGMAWAVASLFPGALARRDF